MFQNRDLIWVCQIGLIGQSGLIGQIGLISQGGLIVPIDQSGLIV